VWAKYRLIAVAVLFGQAAIVTYTVADESPSEELLEFLGEFQTQDGKWIDPLDLMDVQHSEMKSNELQQAESKHTKSKYTELKRNSEEQSDE